jgi:hypothetical protein
MLSKSLAICSVSPAAAPANTGLSWGVVENPDQHWVATGKCRNAKPCSIQNQTIREIVHPSIGGWAVRIRLANSFGTSSVIFKAVYLGLQMRSQLVQGSNHVITFGAKSLTIL